jgi:hypothetical protein
LKRKRRKARSTGRPPGPDQRGRPISMTTQGAVIAAVLLARPIVMSQIDLASHANGTAIAIVIAVTKGDLASDGAQGGGASFWTGSTLGQSDAELLSLEEMITPV